MLICFLYMAAVNLMPVEINLSLAKILLQKGFHAKPKQKLCKRCHALAKTYDDVEESIDDDIDDDTQIVDLDVSLQREKVKSKVTEQLETLEQSPLILHSKKRNQQAGVNIVTFLLNLIPGSRGAKL